MKRQSKHSTGLFVRSEQELNLGRRPADAEPTPDLDEIRRHVPAALFAKIAGRLRPAFTVDVLRTVWAVPFGDSAISLSHDDGHIESPAGREPVQEIELEIEHGRMEAVFEAAQTIAAAVPIRLETASKSDRGYRLVGYQRKRDTKSGVMKLDADVTTAEAFETIATRCIHQFSSQEALFLTTAGPEPLHQMRVAVRRFRSLLKFSDAILPKRVARRLDIETGRVSHGLGAVRDLDILLAALQAEPAAGSADAIAVVENDRALAWQRASTMLRSRRFCARMLDLVAFIECGDWRRENKEVRETPMRDAAAAILRQHWKKLRHAEPPSQLDPPTRHRLRIKTKKFRYACEFYGGLFHGEKQKLRLAMMLEASSGLQDALGRLTDRVAVRAQLVDRFGEDALRLVSELDPNASAVLLDEADAAQDRLMSRKPFWS